VLESHRREQPAFLGKMREIVGVRLSAVNFQPVAGLQKMQNDP
jgi:hypothetical protein